jgi:hypothetical protein
MSPETDTSPAAAAAAAVAAGSRAGGFEGGLPQGRSGYAGVPGGGTGVVQSCCLALLLRLCLLRTPEVPAGLLTVSAPAGKTAKQRQHTGNHKHPLAPIR